MQLGILGSIIQSNLLNCAPWMMLNRSISFFYPQISLLLCTLIRGYCFLWLPSSSLFLFGSEPPCSFSDNTHETNLYCTASSLISCCSCPPGLLRYLRTAQRIYGAPYGVPVAANRRPRGYRDIVEKVSCGVLEWKVRDGKNATKWLSVERRA
jgi:hypothetical protein